jgi:phytanoyl-CoA hydroxylase
MQTGTDTMTDQLTQDEIAAYHRDGFVVARSVFAAEDVTILCREVEQAWQRSGNGQQTQNVCLDGEKHISTIRDPQLHSAVFTRYLTDPRLTTRMAQVVGPNVQLHHSKINVKTNADTVAFPMHQDHPYFPHEKHSVCTVLVYLTDVTSERGCFRAVPGVHEPLAHQGEANHYLDPEAYPLEEAIELPGAAGDVIFMNYLTPHGSNLNQTTEPRNLWIIQIRAAEDRPVAQQTDTLQSTAPGNRPAQGTMLCGVNPDYQQAASGACRQ